MNIVNLLSVLVDMAAITDVGPDALGGDPDAAVRQLYSHYAKALHGYVDQFCPDRASADDIVQETFIRAWHHLPQLSADDRPVRPCTATSGGSARSGPARMTSCRKPSSGPGVTCPS